MIYNNTNRNDATNLVTSKAFHSANRVSNKNMSSSEDLLNNNGRKRQAASDINANASVTLESPVNNTSANSVFDPVSETIGRTHEMHLQNDSNNISSHRMMTNKIKQSKSAQSITSANSVYSDRTIKKNIDSNSKNTLYVRAVEETISKLSIIFPDQVSDENIDKIREIALEGYKLADRVYTAKDAEEWGNHYEVPESLIASDEALFKASMRDIKVMAARRQKMLINNRLNAKRVELYTHDDNPEREKLFLLAGKGMPLLLRDGFHANGQGKLPPLRKTYTSVKSAINRLLVENFHQLGLAFILTKETALTIPGIHFSPLHWTEKQGKRQGRPIGDCSDGGSELNNEPLNSTETKESSDQLWGTIHHPTIEDVANMILDYYDNATRKIPDLNWDDLELFTKDLKGAFTLMFFDADGVQNLAMEMTGERVIIFICGIFGWTGTPAAFQVINRAIIHELKYVLQGTAIMYSDDILVVTTKNAAPHDMQATDKVCSNLMGPNSVEQEKTESGRCVTFIGYDIDLDKQLITISKRNILRTLYGFMNVNLQEPIKVKTMQKLASWASRYGKVCIYMKPFISVLYAEYTGRGDHTSFLLSKKACQVIRYFRVLLGLIAVNGVEFARPLKSFRNTTSNIIIEFDASLTGIGLLYYERTDRGEVLLAGSAIDISILKFKSEASYQNTAEFIAAILGIRGLRQLRLQPESVCLRGDSITALTWASSGKFKGDLVSNAAAVFVLQNMQRKITVSEIIHLAAADNWRTDFLSRGGTMEELLKNNKDLGNPKIMDFSNDMIIQLCCPERSTETEDEFNNFWFDMRRILETNN